jgi:lipid A 3-O-deacylase
MRVLLIAALLTLISEQVSASNNWRNLAVDFGQSTSNSSIGRTSFNLYRLGLQREFSAALLTGEHVSLDGYFEASLNYWDAGETDIYAVAVSPVFALYFGERDGSFRPYVEAGLGGALLSDTEIAGRDLSTTFQFEIRFGVGMRSDRLDFHVRYMHYSNGSIKQPNHGVDAFLVGLAVGF